MKVLSELKIENEQRLLTEIEEIGQKLRLLNPASDEFSILLALMKSKINQLSD